MQDNSITGSDDRATLIAYPQPLTLQDPDVSGSAVEAKPAGAGSNNFEKELEMIAQPSAGRPET